jgi:hypothetical protein
VYFNFLKSAAVQGLIGIDDIIITKLSGASYDSDNGFVVNGGKIAHLDVSGTAVTSGSTATFNSSGTNFYTDKQGQFSLANMFS